MKKFNAWQLPLVLLLLLTACNPKNKKKEAEPQMAQAEIGEAQDDFAVMAYYVAEADYKPENIPVEKLTHIIFSFTNVIDGEMKFRNPERSGPQLAALVEQKKRNPNLKVMIACGGWGADGFSDMALTEEGRTKFINSASDFIVKYKLDGLDMDWEYPGISGAGTKARDEDTENFTALMKGLREMLDTFDTPKVLTFASAGWKRYYDFIETEKVMQYADFMNVMTYDLVSGVSEYTGHHTALGDVKIEEIEGTPFHEQLSNRFKEGKSKDPHPRSTEKIVDFLIANNVDPKQIVIGAAFYGRVWKGVVPDNKGLYQRSGGMHIGWLAYHEIRKSYENNPDYVRHWDEKAQAPYMYNAKEQFMLSYDDTVSVTKKTDYAMEKGLGGIMFWELGNDTKEENGLLDAIYAEATD
ncbi:glycoside hydrolase family 18 protein [Maribacter sp. 2307ULW6-5]|uniref:glycoside hydrolase family 18 protein n=1 Tax=Maribacter sp. 2307ULW6-5 TaxID=3386275 RepID=UPI0039BD05C1